MAASVALRGRLRHGTWSGSHRPPSAVGVVTKGRDITAMATVTRSVKDDLRLPVLAAEQSAAPA